MDIDTARKEIAKLKSEKDHLARTLQEYERQVVDFKWQYAETEEKLQQATDKIYEMRRQRNAELAELESIRDENKRLKQQLKEKIKPTRFTDVLQSTNNALSTERNSMAAEIAALKTENSNLSDALQIANDDRREVESQRLLLADEYDKQRKSAQDVLRNTMQRVAKVVYNLADLHDSLIQCPAFFQEEKNDEATSSNQADPNYGLCGAAADTLRALDDLEKIVLDRTKSASDNNNGKADSVPDEISMWTSSSSSASPSPPLPPPPSEDNKIKPEIKLHPEPRVYLLLYFLEREREREGRRKIELFFLR